VRRFESQAVARSEPGPLRVVLADHDPLVRRLLARTLREPGGAEILGEAADGREAVELAVAHLPDVLLMDIAMPDVDGITATREVRVRAPAVRIVLLMLNDDEDAAIEALRAGAVGIIAKRVNLGSLARALEAARAGEAVFPRSLGMRILEEVRAVAGRPGMRPVYSPLTDREWQVLDLMCQGAGTDAIAEALVLSVATVRSHIKSVLRKLGVRSRQEAIARGLALSDPRSAAR